MVIVMINLVIESKYKTYDYNHLEIVFEGICSFIFIFLSFFFVKYI